MMEKSAKPARHTRAKSGPRLLAQEAPYAPEKLWRTVVFVFWRDFVIVHTHAPRRDLRRCNHRLRETRISCNNWAWIDGRWNRAKTPFRTRQFWSGMSRFDSLSSDQRAPFPWEHGSSPYRDGWFESAQLFLNRPSPVGIR